MVKLNKDLIINLIMNAENTTYLTHNFHPYPAKFIPHIPNLLIKTFTKENDVVMDPFCGSGTSLVEAKLLGRNGIGVDLNYIAVLMSKVKTTKLKEEELKKMNIFLNRIEQRINNYYSKNRAKQTLLSFSKGVEYTKEESFSYTIPDIPNIDHWFKNYVLNELAIIKTSITQSNFSPEFKDFLLLAFSSIIVSISNQESETRYAAIDKNIPPKKTFNLFKNKLRDMGERMLEFNIKSSDREVKIYQADARFLDFINNKVDFIITSPPYPNTYDYYLYHKFRMLWLDFDVKKVQRNEIGSRHKHSSKKQNIKNYLKDMKLCFKCFKNILKPSGNFIIVIGDNIIKGELIKGDDIVKNIAEDTGFKLIDKIKYSLNYSSKCFNKSFRNKNKEEHIILLKNQK